MRRATLMSAALMVLFAGANPAPAKADSVTIDLAQNHIDINTGFHGTYLQIFGVMQEPGDVAIVIEGPPREMIVWKKQKLLGAWVNASFETFENVPSFYAYASSAPLKNLDAPALRAESRSDEKRMKIFKESLIRNKQAQGLFASHDENIVFLNQNFFRTQIYMPANVPVGEYVVKSLYFHEGELREIKTKPLKVAHVGLSARVFKFAQRKRFLYALICIGIALFAGWLSNKIGLRR